MNAYFCVKPLIKTEENLTKSGVNFSYSAIVYKHIKSIFVPFN